MKPVLVKGSPEAKAYMAKLREMRGKDKPKAGKKPSKSTKKPKCPEVECNKTEYQE